MKVWNWLSGKKTIIAAAYWGVVLPAVKVVYSNGIPNNVEQALGVVGLVLTYLGLGHKIKKNIGVK